MTRPKPEREPHPPKSVKKDKAPWISYRPTIRVLDCTIRDGGLMNNSNFDDDFVKAVYETCVESGIDYMEIGYKNSREVFPPDKYGPWRHCDEEDIRRIVGENKTDLKISVMADAGGKSDWKNQIIPKEQSVVDLVRVACYARQISEAIEMITHAHELHYETTCNIMAISTAQDAEIDEVLMELAKSPVDVIYVVDSFGSLYREQIDLLVGKYQRAMEGTGKEIGIHMHNNQQLAFANTIEGIILGANYIDASMAGLGRGAGNCTMELLLGFLRNPKFKIRPVWHFLQEHIVKLREKTDWGPYPIYNITGQMNLHPEKAISWSNTDRKEKCAEFYDKMISDV